MLNVATVIMCLTSAIGVQVSDDSPSKRPSKDQITPEILTKSTSSNQTTTESPWDDVTVEAATPIPANTARRTILVDTDGHRLTGSAAGAGSGKLVYSNDLGQSMFGPGGILPTARIADDIGTIAVPHTFGRTPIDETPSVCSLGRYVIRVNGDRRFKGEGTGDYTVTLALHDTCPGANPATLSGTEAEVTVRVGPGLDVEIASDIIEITVAVPPGIDMGNVHYISVRFSRDHCGVVVGAPARVGFSGDRFDHPFAPCDVNLGGFPVQPHGSFGVDIYARELDCPEAHLIYKNTNHRENFLTPGINRWFADNLRIGVPSCNLIGYEFAYKGTGIIQADLRTALDPFDVLSAHVIPDSRANFFSSAPDDVQVGRHMLPAPYTLSNPVLFIAFRTTSTVTGPIATCQPAQLGDSPNQYFVHNGTKWVATHTTNCFDSFDVTLFCEGLPPVGACCDVVLLDDENEAVCRDGLAQMNCPFPDLWQLGDACEGLCVGGINHGESCMRQADCDGGDCDGPFPHPCGLGACCLPGDGRDCENLTKNECSAVPPLDRPRFFYRNRLCGEGGQRCPWNPCVGRDSDCSFAHPETGCKNPFCCSPVCTFDPWCCEVEWDELCVEWSQRFCDERPSNDECAPGGIQDGAYLLEIPTVVGADCIKGSSNNDDPGFCCHNGLDSDPLLGPGSRGENTVWFRFVAPTDTISLDTCNTTERPKGLGEDSLIQLFEVSSADHGVCADLTSCSVSAQDCLDGSMCEFDVVASCDNLLQIGCNDDGIDSGGSGCGVEGRSKMCVSGLTPGNMYYVMVAARSNREELLCNTSPFSTCSFLGAQCTNNGFCRGTGRFPDRGVFKLNITSECQGIPLLENDRCIDAAIPPGQDDVQSYPISIPFDMSGMSTDTQPASFDCPGPDTDLCFIAMENDIWYDWTAPADGMATIDTCEPVDEFGQPLSGTSPPDTTMVVYRGCDCPVSTSSEDILGCNDFQPFPCFLGSRVSFEAQAGQCYKIRLGGNFGGEPSGDLNINLDVISCPDPIVFLDPKTGTVDARQPSSLGTPFLQGINSVTVSGDFEGATTDCWSLCETANNGFPNSILNFTNHFDGTYTINLTRPITSGAVSTLTYTGDATTTSGQFTSHPGNTNGDAIATVADVMALINYLTDPMLNPLPWDSYSGDVDQSEKIAPGDILRNVDLLNGADGFDVWMDSALPDCGFCCPAP